MQSVLLQKVCVTTQESMKMVVTMATKGLLQDTMMTTVLLDNVDTTIVKEDGF